MAKNLNNLDEIDHDNKNTSKNDDQLKQNIIYKTIEAKLGNEGIFKESSCTATGASDSEYFEPDFDKEIIKK